MNDGPFVALCLNSGSSSLKYAVFELGESETLVERGAVRGIGLPGGSESHAEALDRALDHLGAVTARLQAVGHRIVHGGPLQVGPARIDDALVMRLRSLAPLAPLHLAASLHGIEAVSRRLPSLFQAACFDTAFHATLPDVARRTSLPRSVTGADVRRYGFHGLSYEYALSTLDPLPERIIVAHLGNGASLAAVRCGRSMDTTMGMTPTGGILMGTRTGDLDPGILLYLLREKHLTSDALAEIVDHHSGLLAVGGSSDMKTLLDRRDGDAGARLAVDMFTYAVRKSIGAFAAALGGLDLLVFTGGIGERSAQVRWEACEGLEWMGVKLDAERNQRGVDVVSARESPVVVRVIPANEELVIARHTWALFSSQQEPTAPTLRATQP